MNVKNILETINMIEEQKLDIRTITMEKKQEKKYIKK